MTFVSPTLMQSVTKVLRPVIMLGLLAAGAVMLRHLPGFDHIFSSTELLRHGFRGRCLFICGATLWCAFGLPRHIAGFAAGLAYGPAEGIWLTTIASCAGCAAGFYWSRLAAPGWAREKMGQYFSRIDVLVRQEPFLSVLTLRLLPVGSSLLLNIFGGVSGMKFFPFLGATALGGLPQNLVAVLLGAGVRFDAAWQAVAGGGLFVLSAVLGVWLWRGSRLGRLVSSEKEVFPRDERL